MNELKVIDETASAIIPAEDYKEIAIEWLTSMGLNLKENHKKQFIDICCAFGLNPIKREVYGIPYGDKFNVIVGYESYIKRAELSGRLSGWKVEYNPDQKKATITIHRKDWENPFVHEVFMDEYNTGANLWKSKPITMIKKVAIAQGFRLCFSEILGGMPYTSEELPEMNENDAATSSHSSSLSATSEKKSTKKKLYTTEQADELGTIVSAVYDDNSPIFSTDEKNKYREMLMNGEFESAKVDAEEVLAERIGKATENK